MNIAIIGAGFSGLLAAQGLKALGHEVTVFEKSRGSGGRMSTKRLPWGYTDMGAQYFTAVDPRFKSIVHSWLDLGWCSRWDFTPFRQKDGCIEPSDDNRQRFVGSGGMSNITGVLAKSVNAIFDSTVVRVEKVAKGWQLFTHNSQSIGIYDWLICSQPAEQSLNLLKDHCALADYIPSSIHQPCWAFACSASGDGRIDIDGVFAEKELSWVSRQSSKPGYEKLPLHKNTWVMHFDSVWSQESGRNVDQAQLSHIALKWLQNYIGKDIQITDSASHFWRYARTKERAQTTPALIDSDLKLACIGSWAAGDNVEGAFLSSRYLLDHFDSIV